MNFARKRPLVHLCASFIFPFFLISIMPEEKRMISSAFLILSFIAVMLARIIFLRFKNKISAGISALSVICALVFVLSSLFPIYLFGYRNSKYSEYTDMTVRIRGKVTEVSASEVWYSSFIISASHADGTPVDFGVVVYADFPCELKKNDVIIADLKLQSRERLLYSESYLQRNRILFLGEISEGGMLAVMGSHSDIFTRFAYLNRRIGYKIDTRLTPDASALSKALLLGDDTSVSDILDRDFRRIGLLHIIALSGTHLVFMTFFISLIFKPILKNRRLIEFIEIWLVIFYLLLTGFPSSLFRAGLMLIICKAIRVLKHPPDTMTALFAAVTVMLLLDPYAILDYGLILSFTATFGIVLLFPYFSELKNEFFHKHFTPDSMRAVISFVYDGICASICACVFTCIALIFMFDSFSLIGIISTFIMSPIIIFYMFLSVLVLLNVGFASGMTETVYRLISRLAGILSEPAPVEVSSFRIDLLTPLAFIAVFFIFALIFNMSKGKFVAVAIAVQLSMMPISIITDLANSERLELAYHTVQGGDVILLSQGSNTSLIDVSSGSSGNAWSYAQCVNRAGYTDIDTMTLTHYHSRHSELIEQLNAKMPIRKLLIPIPLSERDIEYSVDIAEVAEQYDIRLEYFKSSGDSFKLSGHELSIQPLKRSSPSAHVQISFTIDNGEEKLAYISENSDLGFADGAGIIMGTH